MLYVAPIGDDTSDCTKDDPCTLTHAAGLASVGRNTILLRPGNYSAHVELEVDATIHGTGAIVTGTSDGSPIGLEYSHALTIYGLTLIGGLASNGDGQFAFRCDGPQEPAPHGQIRLANVTLSGFVGAYTSSCDGSIDQSRLTGTYLGALIAGGTIRIDRTTIESAVASTMADVAITNSTIHTNDADVGVYEGPMSIAFSTLSGLVKCGSNTPICSGDPSTRRGACISDSIMVMPGAAAGADTVAGSGCALSHSIVYPQTQALNGLDNMTVDPMLVDPANGDFHLMPGSPAVDAADPSASDAHDFDGVARPQGAANDIGAFELVQRGS